jgi:hypothetical protein
MREDDAFVLGVTEVGAKGVKAAFMEVWKDSCLEGDSF